MNKAFKESGQSYLTIKNGGIVFHLVTCYILTITILSVQIANNRL